MISLVLKETRRRRSLVPMPFGIAAVIGFFAEFLPKPLITRDQVKQLAFDNVISGDYPTFADLSIEPTAAEVVLPLCLEAYRRSGLYARVQPGLS